MLRAVITAANPAQTTQPIGVTLATSFSPCGSGAHSTPPLARGSHPSPLAVPAIWRLLLPFIAFR